MKQIEPNIDNPFIVKNEAYRISWKNFMIRCLLAAVFGALLILAFPNINFSHLAWVGIIPLYLLVLNLRWVKAFIVGFCWGYGWSVASIIWLMNLNITYPALNGFGYFIPFLLGLVLACFYALWALFIPFVRKYIFIPVEVQLNGYNAEQEYNKTNFFQFKEMLLVLFLSCLWCLLEWLRTWIFTGFPWNLLAISQWQQLGIIQIASVTGIYGVSFIVVFMNIAIAHLCINVYKIIKFKGNLHSLRIIPISLYLAIILILSSFYYGVYRIKEINSNHDKIDFKVGVAQGDLPQIRFYTEKEAIWALDTYVDLSEKVLPAKPDIMIWPESAVPQPLRGGGELSEEYRSEVAKLIRKYRVPILLGTADYDYSKNGELEFYNSAYLINKEGKFVERYNKMHLVPWGEYTPLEFTWPFSYIYPWIKKTFGMGRAFTPGTKNVIFNLKKGIRTSVLICYEDVFPGVARTHVLTGANLLITITNDSWFPLKNELEQHIAQAVFRAVENGRMLIRNGNCAGTCVIQPNGLITDSIFYKKNAKGKMIPAPEIKGKGAAVFTVKVDRNPSLTFYTKYGNIFILICGIAAFLIFLSCLWGWKDKKSILYAKRK